MAEERGLEEPMVGVSDISTQKHNKSTGSPRGKSCIYFPQFSKLPPEIQDIVWRHALDLDAPTVHGAEVRHLARGEPGVHRLHGTQTLRLLDGQSIRCNLLSTISRKMTISTSKTLVEVRSQATVIGFSKWFGMSLIRQN
jgi:hypothetical protein